MPLAPFPQSVAARFKELAVSAWGDRILEVRVFGSMARGDAHEDSDLDVFVKVDEKSLELVRSLQNAACVASEELTAYHPAVSPLIMSAEQFDELVRRERRIALDILREGVLI